MSLTESAWTGLEPWPLRCRCRAFTIWAKHEATQMWTRQICWAQVFPWKEWWVHVALNQTSQTFLSLIISFKGTHQTTNWPAHTSCFVVQLVRTLHRHHRGHGFESRWRYLKIFRCTKVTMAEIVQQVCVRIISSIYLSTTLHKHFFQQGVLDLWRDGSDNATTFAYLMNKNRGFARPSRPFFYFCTFISRSRQIYDV